MLNEYKERSARKQRGWLRSKPEAAPSICQPL